MTEHGQNGVGAAASGVEGLRESIARAIDPIAFGERYIGNRSFLNGPGILERRAAKQAVALTKADDILALTAQHRQQAVVEMREALEYCATYAETREADRRGAAHYLAGNGFRRIAKRARAALARSQDNGGGGK